MTSEDLKLIEEIKHRAIEQEHFALARYLHKAAKVLAYQLHEQYTNDILTNIEHEQEKEENILRDRGNNPQDEAWLY